MRYISLGARPNIPGQYRYWPAFVWPETQTSVTLKCSSRAIIEHNDIITALYFVRLLTSEGSIDSKCIHVYV